ncbi:oligopeptide transporter, OPT family [Muribaculaceae bacterium Isolate-113 (HZI)]|jgi:putative OPT family oligopeptide transporter|uniref:OPT family oligopeptide transporter n=1 Tax=Sangeribacter muris TaxID=2880703 RepID=UPI000F483349|nr:oligopeptide transporter, OPT family [Sangeribacter muris]ROS83845.1 oligopeptide transporter, OPT family [Muribaculaceae bacterium Isolate-036 (Harlan)]ROT19820.1 oligopeptide transporter, OPT family [Muribaculaceae bacterium Isolate-114 (HZI)]ROT21466.1 oligopeptide transporter, OPT family [Muribaculaceae bacterium Isolate-113 (HZI)]RXE67772.1 oligopeptide transporter, OPT family [Muribaculaceae bacterium Isolate-001 (NCI)]
MKENEEVYTTDTGLPENAFRELAKDEQYVPVMKPAHDQKEVTPYSVGMGLLMAVVFSAAAAYLGLKVGQVFEAAIPIAIIAVGLSNALKKKNSLGQNVIIQSIGSCSGVIVAGAIFTLPALFILQATYPDIMVEFYQIFLSSLLGGILGILFFIPFRKYFVKDMHGKYPFPEATATTQVLVSGQQSAGAESGGQAKTLVIASLIGGIYDYIVATFGWWAETVTSTASAWGQTIAEKTKLVLSCNTGAALLGLGYIVGLKYAFVIFAGSIFVWWIIIPLLGTYGSPEFQAMSPDALFKDYARMIGIGGIAMAGVIGIVKSWPIIRQAVGLAGREFKGGAKSGEKPVRWQLDISMKHVVFFIALALIAVFVFFWLGVIHTLWQALVAWLVVTVIAFLFTTVAANAIAIVGSNPVSGMTLMTLIVASAIFVSIGLSGTSGIVASMVIGGVVCTALSMAGGFVTDLKIGYWLGTTPKKQETWKFLGTLVSAATVGGVIIVLNKVYGFTGDNALVAPQANAMAKVIEPLMMGGETPWILYMVGAILALILNWLGVPALAFCLGMFIPLSLNTPMLVGGAVSYFVSNSSKDKKVNDARRDRGTLISSGLIAGGALFGVFAAITRFAGFEYTTPGSEQLTQILGCVAYALLIIYLIRDSKRA